MQCTVTCLYRVVSSWDHPALTTCNPVDCLCECEGIWGSQVGLRYLRSHALASHLRPLVRPHGPLGLSLPGAESYESPRSSCRHDRARRHRPDSERAHHLGAPRDDGRGELLLRMKHSNDAARTFESARHVHCGSLRSTPALEDPFLTAVSRPKSLPPSGSLP